MVYPGYAVVSLRLEAKDALDEVQMMMQKRHNRNFTLSEALVQAESDLRGSMMKQVTLSPDNYQTLTLCVAFCVEELSTTDGSLTPTHTPDKNKLPDVLDLKRAIEFCTRDVAP